MSADFTSREDLSRLAPQDSVFAPTPVYARNTKKTRRPRTLTVSNMAGTSDATAERGVSPGRKVPAAALIAIPAAIVVLGGAFYLMQPRDTGMAPLASNTETAPSALATAPAVATPAAAPAETMPVAEPVAKPAPLAARAERAATPAAEPRRETRVARARPAPTPSASDSAADASALTPDTPQPYGAPATPPSATAPAMVTPPPVTEPVNPAPAMETPAPDVVTGATPEIAPTAPTATP